ncbi:acyl-CoA dehydrogenase family protein [Pelotomaculum isophthalicicum JI]|uniref:Acyl-CoA dehydrogenase family protein n=1 Tax=Pelotomaculum isophthalicicum JI TaxID=947010 RepID=A0A9X4H7L1_9FIRM|nr:acyl-CoA dehydrogenase family protein [Pelotomaculum isophthalicicum]MDF9409659.1 acyl-CoA dehydrogenase family protein [Pelotomaculum isophthalicicum JI]
MNFELDKELVFLKEMVRDLAQEKIAPRAAEIDEKDEFPWDIKEALAEHEILAMPFPEEYGGTGGKALPVVIAVEEIAKVSASVAMIPGGQCLGSAAIVIAGTEEQKQRFLPGLASGEKLCAYALTEPNAGSDVGGIQSTAVLDGDEYVINGTKRFISFGNIADILTVFAKTIDQNTGQKKLSCFAVEKGEGLVVRNLEHKMGVKGTPTAELFFDNMRVPKENLLGAEGDGFKIAMQVLDKTRSEVAAQALGLAQGALDFAVQYARDRVQFGSPIGKFQAIQMKLADMEIKTQAARYLTYVAADKYDRKVHDRGKYTAIAKAFASDAAMEVTSEAIQILGGYGYSKEYPLERMFRDAKIQQIYEGTNEIQRIVIARSLLGRGF